MYILEYQLIDLIGFVLVTATFATLSEITSKKGTDNFSIPIISILIMIGINDQLIIQQGIINKLNIAINLNYGM